MPSFVHTVHRVFFVILGSCMTFMAVGQDLIERTRSGKQLLSEEKNRIASELVVLKSDDVVAPFAVDQQKSINLYQDFIDDAVLLHFNHDAILQFLEKDPSYVNLKVPVTSSASFELRLAQVDVLTEDYFMSTDQGVVMDRSLDDARFYRGIVEGNGQSIAAVSVFKGKIKIFISDEEGTYTISPFSGKKGSYILINEKRLKHQNPIGCDTDDILHNTGKAGRINQLTDKSNFKMASTCVPIYIETDKYSYDRFGSTQEVESYFSSLVNEVATLYANEGITISLASIYAPTSSANDWSASLDGASSILQEFARIRKNDYNGRLAHFASLRPMGSGVAWLGVLCSTYFTFTQGGQVNHAGPYAVSTSLSQSYPSFPNWSWTINVFAHEMGHNFGSPHTQSCSWGPNNDRAIDNCRTEGNCSLVQNPTPSNELGTIMSYCHLTNIGVDFNKGFGSEPGALLLNAYTNASCTLECTGGSLPGCTDPNYHNYNPFAEEDNGSCLGTCSDGIQNGDETGVDCGGNLCASCLDACNENYVRVTLNLDLFPQETTWELINTDNNQQVASGGPYSGEQSVQKIFEICDSGTCFRFVINDSYGDGICCQYGNGSYLVADRNGDIIIDNGGSPIQGASFGSSASHDFCVGTDCTDSGVVTISSSNMPLNVITNGRIDINSNLDFPAGTYNWQSGQSINFLGVFNPDEDVLLNFSIGECIDN